MKKLFIYFLLVFISMGLLAHPKPYTLNDLIRGAKFLLSGEILSVEPFAFTLRIDSVYYGDYPADTIRITESNPYYPDWTHRIQHGYKAGDRKLIFVGVNTCEEMEYTSVGIYLEGELSVTNDSVQWNKQQSSLDNFLHAIESFRKLNRENPDQIRDSLFCRNFSATSFVHAELIGNARQSLINAEIVREPGPVRPVLAATKMNVLYLGVDNPLHLAFDGTDTRELILTAEDAEITNYGNGYFNCRPDTTGNLAISISKTTPDGPPLLVGQFGFRVKRLPDPVPFIGGVSGGPISKGVLMASAIIPKVMNFDYDINYRVTSFRMSTSRDQDILVSCSNMLTDKMQAKILPMQAGEIVTLFDIQVIGPDKLVRDVGKIECILK